MRELFYPLMTFFLVPQPDTEMMNKFKKLSEDAPFDAAIYDLLVSFNEAR